MNCFLWVINNWSNKTFATIRRWYDSINFNAVSGIIEQHQGKPDQRNIDYIDLGFCCAQNQHRLKGNCGIPFPVLHSAHTEFEKEKLDVVKETFLAMSKLIKSCDPLPDKIYQLPSGVGVHTDKIVPGNIIPSM